MTRYVKIENDEVVKVGLPQVGSLADGRLVSGFDKLDSETLNSLGWIEVDDSPPPAYDANTHRLVDAGWVVANGSATHNWVVEPIPAEELAAREAVRTRELDAQSGLDRIAEIPNIRTKLRAVAAGNDTFTAAQMQKLLAGLALEAIRNRTDV